MQIIKMLKSQYSKGWGSIIRNIKLCGKTPALLADKWGYTPKCINVFLLIPEKIKIKVI